jgi:hypothetical protein
VSCYFVSYFSSRQYSPPHSSFRSYNYLTCHAELEARTFWLTEIRFQMTIHYDHSPPFTQITTEKERLQAAMQFRTHYQFHHRNAVIHEHRMRTSANICIFSWPVLHVLSGAHHSYSVHSFGRCVQDTLFKLQPFLFGILVLRITLDFPRRSIS